MPDDDPANDNYKNLGDPLQETLNQLQILEHIENSPRGLSQQDRALKERLEKYERELRARDSPIKEEPPPKHRSTANDNENPDESWQRADLILEAYSGADLNVAENQKTAITQLLTDLMHYCEVMSMDPKNPQNHLDFEELLDTAYEHFEVQDHLMKSVMDATLERQAHYVAEKLSELKNPTKEKEMSDFTDKVQFTQDPEFIKLQRALQLRQEQESKELEKQQTEQRIQFGRQPGVTRQQLDDNYKRQLQEREAQSKNHKAETDRYTRDYHDAKVLREEMREKEKRDTLERGLDPDKPKLTR